MAERGREMASGGEVEELLAGPVPRSTDGARQPEITLHQLRIFWAVAHSETVTLAAKQIGLAQPSLSQQLSRLESAIGVQLFNRRSGQMELTEAGHYLLARAEHVLRSMRELEDGLAQFSSGRRVTLRLAGIASVLRQLVPEAVALTQARFPDADFDIQESAPADILELLYARRINIGLVASNSLADAGVGFLRVPVLTDPYVLVVPERLKLDAVHDPARDLSPADCELLNRTIQFIFGTQHARRVSDWYDQVLPDNRVVAQCRSFEVATGLVRAGSGICLAPALSTANEAQGVRRYRVNIGQRQIVALVPSQYRRVEPYASLLDDLERVGARTTLPEILPPPPFLMGSAPTEL